MLLYLVSTALPLKLLTNILKGFPRYSHISLNERLSLHRYPGEFQSDFRTESCTNLQAGALTNWATIANENEVVHSTGFSIEMILRKRAYLKIISIEKERSDTSSESRDGKKDFLLTIATKRSILNFPILAWNTSFASFCNRVPMNRVELLSEAYESPVLTVELHRQVRLRYSISLSIISNMLLDNLEHSHGLIFKRRAPADCEMQHSHVWVMICISFFMDRLYKNHVTKLFMRNPECFYPVVFYLLYSILVLVVNIYLMQGILPPHGEESCSIDFFIACE